MHRRWILGGAVVALLLTAAVLPAQTQSTSAVKALPADARAGECYAKVEIPATYKTETARVTKREAAEQIEIVPAKYEWVEEKVVVKEGYDKISVVPATYKWVEEKVMVSPASKEIKEVPATYKWAEEKVLVTPARTVWKPGRGPVERHDHATGEIMCKVEEPAVYKTVRKKVLDQPARTETVEIPAKYKTVKKQVIDKPATTKTTKVPPEYATVKVKKLVTPAQEKRVPVPAEFTEVTKNVLVSEGSVEWMPVLCETNMSNDLVTSIQRALQSAGYDPGPIDGMIGSRTMQAVYSFQRAKGLAQGALTMDTLKALNVSVR